MFACRDVPVLAVPADLIDKFWTRWQSLPHLGTVQVPVGIRATSSLLNRKDRKSNDKFLYKLNYLSVDAWSRLEKVSRHEKVHDCCPRSCGNATGQVRAELARSRVDQTPPPLCARRVIGMLCRLLTSAARCRKGPSSLWRS